MKKILGKSLSFLLAFSLMLSSFLALSAVSGTSDASAASTYTSELWMMADYSYALVKGTKKQISDASPDAAPYLFMGNTMTSYIPISALCLYTGASYTVDGNNVTVTLNGGAQKTLTIGSLEWSGGTFLLPPVLTDGEVYLSNMSCQALFSVKAFTNLDIGLFVFSTGSLSYNTKYSSLKTQIQTLRFLLFDTITGSGIASDLVSNVGSGTHPRLLADQDRFDELSALYAQYVADDNTTDDYLTEYVVKYVNKANTYFNSLFEETEDSAGKTVYQWLSLEALQSTRQPYFLYDDNGNRITTAYANLTDEQKEELKTTYNKTRTLYNDGYDEGGRSSVDTQTQKLYYFGFAWQITKDEKYVYAFYQLAKQLGNWVHWGEGHFLDCADGASFYAMGLDWIWNAFDDEPAKRKELTDILYNKAVNVAYYCIYDKTYGKNNGILHRSSMMGENWGLTGYSNNWNTVCCSGITLAALTLVDDEAYAAESKYVMEKQMNSIYKCLIQYAPDGSYIESPGYWGYGTNTYILMLAALQTATGKTYGFLDTVGLQNSYYFMNNIADSDFYVWNYHDGGRGRIDGSTFYMASSLYGDPTIAYYRDLMVERYPSLTTLYDVLFYDSSLSVGADTDTSLDQKFLGIQTATMRSSWEKGSIFTGLHVGANVVSHGDIDCGNIYLEMGGVLWLADPGSEDYNIGNYFNSKYRYYFYKKTLESHSTILIKPQAGDTSSNIYLYGQTYNSQSADYAKIDTFVSDENGSYAISNMKVQYGDTCDSATRGLLLTNSRSTVIVQDDITFNTPTSLVWIGALSSSCYVKSISEDGRTAYLYGYSDSQRVILRASIVSDDESLVFSTNNNTNILPKTVTATTNNPNNKYTTASSFGTRLCIEANDVTSFHCAVVFELYKAGGTEEPIVGYEYTDPSEWTTSTDEWVNEANKDIVYPSEIEYKYTLSSVVRALDKIEAAEDVGERLKLIKSTSILLTDISPYDSAIQEKLAEYQDYIKQYNAYIRKQNVLMEENFTDVIGMFGKQISSTEEKDK